MAEPFIAEIRLFSFAFAPRGWAQCNGQFLAISQNQALFALVGTMYGGNGQTTFALPDVRDRTLLGFNQNFPQGQAGGQASHTLTNSEIPSHTHTVQASNTLSTLDNPAGAYAGAVSASGTKGQLLYSITGADSSAMVLSITGGNQPHENHQPTTVLNYCIALQGIFPSQN